MLKMAFYTLGCKSNQYETSLMEKACSLAGFDIVPFDQPADIYIINTCTVTGNADKKSRNAIRHAKKKNRNSVVIVTGCYVDSGPDELYGIKEADILLKNADKRRILDYLPNIKNQQEHVVPHPPMIRSNLMIENGCDNFCSYCIVPFVRGSIVSKPIEQAIAEARELVEDGVKEIVLTGINLGEYGKNITRTQYHIDDRDVESHKNEPLALPRLIDGLSGIDGLLRIRLSSIEPMYITDELIRAVKENPKVCKHLHIPLQSGDDRVLRSMNRKYTSRQFLETVKHIKKHIKDISVTTDVIVGFPGEDDKAFNSTVNIIKKLKFPRIHLFSYSDRPKTSAFNLKNKVNPKIILQRYEKIEELRLKYMLEFHRSFAKKPMEVLIEQKDPDMGIYEGFTTNYIRVFWDARVGLPAEATSEASAKAGDDSGDDCIGKLKSLIFKGFHGENVIA